MTIFIQLKNNQIFILQNFFWLVLFEEIQLILKACFLIVQYTLPVL